MRRGLYAQHGVSLVELLIAAAILATVLGAVFGLLQSVMQAWSVQPHASDQLQRLRVGVSSLQGQLAASGGGVDSVGGAAVALHDYFAPVLPYRLGNRGTDPPGTSRRDVISVMYVPRRPAFSAVLAVRLDSANQTTLEIPLDCGAAARPRCGFEAGQQVVLLDASSRWDRATVTLAADGILVVQHGAPLRVRSDASPAVAELSMHTYYLGVERLTGTPQLVHYDGDRTNMPVVDDMAALAFEYWGEPLAPAEVRDAPRPRVTYGPAPPVPGTESGTSWPEGENCTFAVVDGAHVPRLPALGPAGTLVRLTDALVADGPWCPDERDPERFDADLLRIRRVRVRMQFRPGAAWLRRPAGAGSLPGYAVEFDVVPRALSLERSWR